MGDTSELSLRMLHSHVYLEDSPTRIFLIDKFLIAQGRGRGHHGLKTVELASEKSNILHFTAGSKFQFLKGTQSLSQTKDHWGKGEGTYEVCANLQSISRQ